MDWYINKTNNQVLTNFEYSSLESNTPFFYIDGYVIPRLSICKEFENLNQTALLNALYNQYELDFINYIKGVFTIIVYINNKWILYTDNHSIKKYFIYKKNDSFIISNSLNYISNEIELEIDLENSTIFALTSHFILGETAFGNLKSSKAGQVLTIEDGKTSSEYYWQPKNLFKIKIDKKKSTEYYARYWEKLIHSYINYLNPKGISTTITGGNDSRMILSALLPFKHKLHGFSFGNPKSSDGIYALQISKCLEIGYSNYFISKPTSDWFGYQAQKISNYGNSLVNIHRAHRNDAIEREHENAPNSEMIFTGLVGGEYLKEPKNNNATIPSLFIDIQGKSEFDAKKIIIERISKLGINIKVLNIDKLYNIIQSATEFTFDHTIKQQKFLSTYYFYGCTHHTQDSIVFSNHIKYLVNPFMDIDFLEMIAAYPNWFVNKKSSIFNNLFHSTFFVSITDYLAPQLSQIPYAKKGEYTADELLRHKTIYLINRIKSRIFKNSKQYPSNFPMGKWLHEFSANYLKNNAKNNEGLFDLKFLSSEINKISNKKTEESWHIITNPINLEMIYDKFKKI